MPEKLSLGGREFERVDAERMPVRLDLWITMHARHAGILGVPMAPRETPDAYAQRMIANMLASGRALLLLGGLLVPAGTDPLKWSEDLAKQTAEHLGSISNPEHKRELFEELARTALAFFEEGLGSWIASMRSSNGAAESSNTSSTTPIPTSESGPVSSAKSPATIST